MITRWPARWLPVLLFLFSVQLFSQNLTYRIQNLLQRAEKEEQLGDLKNASEEYLEILRLDPKQSEAYQSLGKLLLEQGNYHEAEKYLKQAIVINRNLATAHQLLGITYFQIGDFELAQRELQKALKIRPNDGETAFFLARASANLGKLRKAAQLLETLREQDPRDAKVLYTLGLVYMKLGDSTLGDLQKFHPESYLNDLLMGTVAEENGQFADAVEHFKNAVTKAPSAPGLHYALGNAFYLEGQTAEALKEFEHENLIDPYNYMAHVLSALIALSTDPQKAFELSTQAIKLKPDSAPAYLIRGRALLGLKKPKDALSDLKKAAVIDPHEKTVHFQLARAYQQLGLISEATREETIFKSMSKAKEAAKRASVQK